MDKPLKVFLIEDSDAIRESLSHALQASGRLVICGTADRADEAVPAIENSGADVVIVDLQLRQGNGFDVLNALNNAPCKQPLVKMVLTNYATAAFRRRSLALGAEHFFDKSLEFERIIDTLNVMADQSPPLASGELPH